MTRARWTDGRTATLRFICVSVMGRVGDPFMGVQPLSPVALSRSARAGHTHCSPTTNHPLGRISTQNPMLARSISSAGMSSTLTPVPNGGVCLSFLLSRAWPCLFLRYSYTPRAAASSRVARIVTWGSVPSSRLCQMNIITAPPRRSPSVRVRFGKPSSLCFPPSVQICVAPPPPVRPVPLNPGAACVAGSTSR